MMALVCQPPTTEIYIRVDFLLTALMEHNELYRQDQTLDNPAELKMGDILSALYDHNLVAESQDI
jgi:hypothetical protein